MEFIFELFAEILGRNEESMVNASPANQAMKADEAISNETERETAAEPELQQVNIFNVVNFH